MEKYNEVVPVLLQGISFFGDFPSFKEKVGIQDHHALHVCVYVCIYHVPNLNQLTDFHRSRYENLASRGHPNSVRFKFT